MAVSNFMQEANAIGAALRARTPLRGRVKAPGLRAPAIGLAAHRVYGNRAEKASCNHAHIRCPGEVDYRVWLHRRLHPGQPGNRSPGQSWRGRGAVACGAPAKRTDATVAKERPLRPERQCYAMTSTPHARGGREAPILVGHLMAAQTRRQPNLVGPWPVEIPQYHNDEAA